jgi:soluble lytic murein transglycosylase-like protein
VLVTPTQPTEQIHAHDTRARAWSQTELEAIFRLKAQAWGVPPELLLGIAWTESRFDPRATGGLGEIGMFQVLPATGRRLFDRAGYARVSLERLRDPGVGAWTAAELLNALSREVGLAGPRHLLASWEPVIHAYNTGGPRYRSGLRSPDYVGSVLQFSMTRAFAGLPARVVA